MSQRPKVSVVIPVYNAEKYLKECLDSVADQTLKEIEVLCVDDGSTDGSLDILYSYASKDPRVRVFHAIDSQGSGPARNLAMRQASGEYIAFMDADDLYPERNTLDTLYATAIREKVKICGGSLNQLQENGMILSEYSGDYSGQSFSSNSMCSYADYQFAYGYQRFIFLRTMLLENKIFFPDYLRCQDPPFMARAMLCAGNFYHISDVTYVHRLGHKQIDWTTDKVCDCIKGLTEVVAIAVEHNMPKLYGIMTRRFLRMCFEDFFDKVELPEVVALRSDMNAMLDFSAIEESGKKTLIPLRNKKIIIYGTGGTGKAVSICLQHNADIHLLGACNSRTATKQMWCHSEIALPLCSIQEWKRAAPDATILIATLEAHHIEITKICEAAGFQNIIPLRQDMLCAILGHEYCRRFGRQNIS